MLITINYNKIKYIQLNMPVYIYKRKISLIITYTCVKKG